MGNLRALPLQVVQHGKTACELAEELRQLRNTWAGKTNLADACGFVEAARAFNEMDDAWFEELSVYIRALEELCAGVQVSAHGYASQDGASAADLSSVL